MNLPTHIRRWWSQHQVAALRTAIAVMAVLMAVKLGLEFYRLLFDHGYTGAIDLRFRYNEVHRWFSHLPVYSEIRTATYPPASYAILWLLLGWAPLSACRWLWAAASLLSLCWLAWMMVRESGASTRLERVFVALLPFSLNAAGVSVGNGQLVVLLVPMLLATVVLLARKPDLGWACELTIVVLMLASLVQPASASPFFWIVIFTASRLRPALLVVLGYLALSLLAAAFQADDLLTLIREWLSNGQVASVGYGYADLHRLLTLIGLHGQALPASILVLAGLGLWTFVHRRLDPWLLLGVTAAVARLWTYHGPYDDFLIVFPMVALFRIAKGPSRTNGDIKAAVLLASAVVIMLMPVRMLYYWHLPWPVLFTLTHSLVWLAALAFLLMRARTEMQSQAVLASARPA